jgi:sugar lactone lactonase YvrE
MTTYFFRLLVALTAILLFVPPDTRADILYVSDATGPDVYQVNTAAGPTLGQGTTNPVSANTAGGFTFNTPAGVVLDTNGNLYIADLGSSVVTKFTRTASGGFLNQGSFTSSSYASGSHISQPNGVAFDTTGNLFVAQVGNSGQLSKVPSGGDTTNGGTLFGPTISPSSFTVAVSPKTGVIYVATPFATGVTAINTNGTAATFSPISTGTYGVQGMAFDSSGSLYLSEVAGGTGHPNQIGKQLLNSDGSPNGSITAFATGGLNNPQGLAFDQAGFLYIADIGGPNGTSGGVVDRVGSGGGAITLASIFASGFASPKYITVLTVTPEPSSLALLSMAASALAGCGWWVRRRSEAPTHGTPHASTAISPEGED